LDFLFYFGRDVNEKSIPLSVIWLLRDSMVNVNLYSTVFTPCVHAHYSNI